LNLICGSALAYWTVSMVTAALDAEEARLG
jgi:hypothetical protein